MIFPKPIKASLLAALLAFAIFPAEAADSQSSAARGTPNLGVSAFLNLTTNFPAGDYGWSWSPPFADLDQPGSNRTAYRAVTNELLEVGILVTNSSAEGVRHRDDGRYFTQPVVLHHLSIGLFRFRFIFLLRV